MKYQRLYSNGGVKAAKLAKINYGAYVDGDELRNAKYKGIVNADQNPAVRHVLDEIVVDMHGGR